MYIIAHFKYVFKKTILESLILNHFYMLNLSKLETTKGSGMIFHLLSECAHKAAGERESTRFECMTDISTAHWGAQR